MSAWENYTDRVSQHTVVGELLRWPGLHSPQLNNQRDVLVWLPASYRSSGRRYPVLYMHDGQNLFDAETSYVGEWQVDETLLRLGAEGREAIIVGLPNQGDDRVYEYDPYPPDVFVPEGGRGDRYLDFIIETVKPLIDGSFRTLPGQPHTGIAGSSMGGLISLYALLTRPDVFSFCGAFSPAFWFGDFGLERTVAERARGAGRLYMDVGGREGHVFMGQPGLWTGSEAEADATYLDGVRRLRTGLLAGGYREPETLLYVEEAEALHREDAWARRLPDALRFLLPQP